MDIHAGAAHSIWLNGRITINNTTVTALRVGAANLSERKWLKITNTASEPVYLGSSTVVSGAVVDIDASTIAVYGDKLAAGDSAIYPVSEGITMYALSNSNAGAVVRIIEAA